MLQVKCADSKVGLQSCVGLKNLCVLSVLKFRNLYKLLIGQTAQTIICGKGVLVSNRNPMQKTGVSISNEYNEKYFVQK